MHAKEHSFVKKNENKQNKAKRCLIDVNCCICFKLELKPGMMMIYCNVCAEGIHYECANIRDIIDEEYHCLNCRKQVNYTEEEEEKQYREIKCEFCQQSHKSLFKSQNNKYFHIFCCFMNNDWSLLSQLNLKTKQTMNSKCLFCKKMSGVIVNCSGCNKHKFHHFCGYFSGLYFKVIQTSKNEFKDYIRNDLKYSTEMFCHNCTVERLDDMVQDENERNTKTRKKLEDICRNLGTIQRKFAMSKISSVNLFYMIWYYRVLNVCPKECQRKVNLRFFIRRKENVFNLFSNAKHKKDEHY